MAHGIAAPPAVPLELSPHATRHTLVSAQHAPFALREMHSSVEKGGNLVARDLEAFTEWA